MCPNIFWQERETHIEIEGKDSNPIDNSIDRDNIVGNEKETLKSLLFEWLKKHATHRKWTMQKGDFIPTNQPTNH